MNKGTVDFEIEIDGETQTYVVDIYDIYKFEKEVNNVSEEQCKKRFAYGCEFDIVYDYSKNADFQEWLVNYIQSEYKRLCRNGGKHNTIRTLFKNN